MNISVDKTKVTDFNIENDRKLCNEALDQIWTEEWLKRSVTKADKESLEKVQNLADQIRARNLKTIVITSGEIGVLLNAVKEIMPEEEGQDLVIFGDTFSPSEYAELINDINDKEFILVVVTGKEDHLSTRGAYATLKHMLVSKYGVERAAENIYAVVSKEEDYVAEDVTRNSGTTIFYSADVPEIYAAGTEPVLLLIALMGGDIEKYLEGFRDMLASPKWDIDGADYSIARAQAFKEGYKVEHIIYMQKQLSGLGRWMEEFEYGLNAQSLHFPRDQRKISDKGFTTYISIERDEEDIMMPYFEGADVDGSLNILVNQEGNKFFFEKTKNLPGVKISLEWLDTYNLGQLFAFLQLSNSITEFFYNN